MYFNQVSLRIMYLRHRTSLSSYINIISSQEKSARHNISRCTGTNRCLSHTFWSHMLIQRDQGNCV